MKSRTYEFILQKTLNDLKTEDFGIYTYLLSRKIAFDENKNFSVQSLGEKFGFDPQLLIEKSRKLNPYDFEDEIEFKNLSNELLVEYLTKTHHSYFKTNIPQFIAEGVRLLKNYGDAKPEMSKIVKLFNSLCNDLVAHMEEEEKYLFPLYQDEDQQSVSDKLKKLELTHDEADGALKQLNIMCDGFNGPFLNSEIKKYYHKLHEFSNKLYAHIHIEQNILFPRIAA